MRRTLYALALVVGLTCGASVDAAIIWSNCPNDGVDSTVCMDSYDRNECGAQNGQPLNECGCDHHGYTWTGTECVE